VTVRDVGCCGQARAALRSTLQASSARTSRAGPATPRGELRLQNVRGESLRVRGVSTGQTYVFTPGEPIQAVHPADATVLLRSGHFRPVR